MRALLLIGAIVTAGVVGVLAGQRFTSTKTSVTTSPAWVGSRLPDLDLRRLDGTKVRLQELLRNGPTLMYVMSLAECTACSSLPTELRIVRRQTPRLQAVLIGSGASPERSRALLACMELDDVALIDESQSVLQGLGLDRSPVVVLADSSGRILLLDTRDVSRASQYPMSRILYDM